ncbi:MAG: ketoacyl-ACP synthase III [Bacteroidales bacterium]|jgi:3-oxoacyl-[acyl-carrier-protein] synthase-3|nr:ketoacyl-ACP synthase III [Bacteroidales bacterium]
MFIDSVGHYLPSQFVSNDYFLEINGLSDEWIYSRTGIKTRTRASSPETTHTMGIEAVKEAVKNLTYPIKEVDLVVGASYTPYDTVGTLAHAVQREFSLKNAKAVYISSACSSFINAVEIVEGYFAMGKAKHALIVVSEHNSAYSNDQDEKSGHLWGDGAACIFLSSHQTSSNQGFIQDVFTQGLGHIGRSIDAVFLHPMNGGLLMPYGKDVFVHACNYMIYALEIILERNGYTTADLDYLIPHQANIRIIEHIRSSLELPREKVITHLKELGNTGSASTLIALSQQVEKIFSPKLIAITVFGGGYSCGSMLLRY